MYKTVDTTTLRNHIADVVSEVSMRKEYILVTRKSKPMAAIVNLDLLEDLLALSGAGYLRSIREARKDYREGRILSHAEVFGKV